MKQKSMKQKMSIFFVCFAIAFYGKTQNIGIGTNTPQAKFSVGINSEFQVDNAGNIKKINNVTFSFPTAQSTNNQLLVNNGEGQLTWVNNNAIYATATGSNSIVLTTTPIITSYKAGTIFNFKAVASNTGNVTINLNGLGVKNVYKNALDPLISNDIISGQMVAVIYDGTNFQLLTQNSKIQNGSGNGSNPLTMLYLSTGF